MPETTSPKPLPTDPARLAARYTAVWGEPDAHVRRAAITELWTADGVEFVNGAQFRGYDELDARITGAYGEFVGNGEHTVAHADDVTRHEDIVTFTVQLVSTGDGQVAWAARVFLLVDDNGRIREDYQVTVQSLPA